MKPHRMLLSPKPPKVTIKIITKIIATTQNKQRKQSREMGCFFAVILVDNEAVYGQTARKNWH